MDKNEIQRAFMSLFGGGDIRETLSKMFRFTPTSEVHEDCTCDFRVLFPKGSTVGDLIAFALTQDEWGDIDVINGNVIHRLEYTRGTIDDKAGRVKQDGIPDHIKRMKVKAIEAYGGWSMMNYKITI